MIGSKNGASGLSNGTGELIEFNALADESYSVARRKSANVQQNFVPVGGVPAATAKKLGPVEIGLFNDRN